MPRLLGYSYVPSLLDNNSQAASSGNLRRMIYRYNTMKETYSDIITKSGPCAFTNKED